ncbi:MAG: flagellin-like protein [Hahellaceae bacterium]|nr:flagellin-like protein [Hahellaceae bacterium]
MINVNSPGISRDSGTTRALETNLERLSSGKRINSAKDDAAGLAAASQFTRQIDGLGVAIRNAGDGISYTQVGSGGLENLRNDYSRIRELAVQAANGTLNSSDRKALQEEANQLMGNIRSTLDNTNFNGQSLFKSDESVDFQTGAEAGQKVTLSTGNLSKTLEDKGALSLNLSDPKSASAALSTIDEGLQAINETDSSFGAFANRLESSIAQLENQREASATARSRIEDADVAKEASSLIANRIRDQIGIAVQAQANTQSRYVLSLLS